jgi:hypothetical protein
MALKVGTENKRNVYIAGGLFAVVAILAFRMLFSGDSTPAPAARPIAAQPAFTPARPAATSRIGIVSASSGPSAHKLPPSSLDPALHLEKLASSESIEYAGNGRNIFSADSAPVVIEQQLASARNTAPEVPAGPPPYVAPTAPAIELTYFGYSADKAGNRQAFFKHGDDIWEGAAGEVVNHRYKIVSVLPASVQVTDLSYNNTQTLSISGN